MITNESSPLTGPSTDTALGISERSPNDLRLQNLSPNNPPWGLLKGFFAWIASVACLVFVPVAVVIPYFVYLYATSAAPRPEALTTDKTFLFLSILGVIPAHLLTFGIVWAIVTEFGRFPFWKTIGFSWPPSHAPWTSLGLSIGLAVVLLSIGGLVTSFFGGEKTQLDQLIESSYQARLATAFLAIATGPLIEELVYRGVLYPAVARALGVGAAVAIVSLLFAGVHVYQYKNNLAVIAVITLLSVTLTVVRAMTGRLLPCFVIHFVFNGLQSVFLVLQPFFDKSDKVVPTPAPACELIVQAIRHLS